MLSILLPFSVLMMGCVLAGKGDISMMEGVLCDESYRSLQTIVPLYRKSEGLARRSHT